MHSVNGFAKAMAIAALVGSTVSCGDLVRSGKGASFLVIDKLEGQRGGAASGGFGAPLLSDVLTKVTSPAPCSDTTPCPTYFNDLGQVTLWLVPKDNAATVPFAPSANNQVTISRYRVEYKRTDGRNTPGVDVPYPWVGAVSGLLQPSGSAVLTFELVRHTAKQEAPLAGLAISPSILTTITEVTFYGQDVVGNEISATGTIQINFGDFGDF